MKFFKAALLTCSVFSGAVNTALAFDDVEIPRKVHFSSLSTIADNALKITVTVQDGSKEGLKGTTWQLSSSEEAVFYTKFKSLQNAIESYSPLKITNPESSYEGLKVIITDKNGRDLLPFYVYNYDVKDERYARLSLDPMRSFEYWLWSTGAPENLDEARQKLPIIDFDQCAELGHRIIETTPRQCLLTNGDIFLDVLEQPTQESIGITNFDECLVQGQALINTFPRRCIAAGGHVFTEPPRLKKVAPIPGLDDLAKQQSTPQKQDTGLREDGGL